MENLDDKSLAELIELKGLVEEAIERAEIREKEAVLEEMKSLAESKGFSIEELFGKGKMAKPRKTVAIKYQDPSDSSNTWTGRGKKPKWLENYLNAGRNLEEFGI